MKPTIYILILILLSTCITANDYFIDGVGTFNNAGKDTRTFTPATGDFNLSTGYPPVPVFMDMDEDGIEEMISIDGTQLKLYNINYTAFSVQSKDAYDFGVNVQDFKVYNFDYPVVYGILENDTVFKLTYNNSIFEYDHLSLFDILDPFIGCGEDVGYLGDDICIVVEEDALWTDAFYINITDSQFVYEGSEGIVSTLNIDNGRPDLRHIAFGDADYDNVNEAYGTLGDGSDVVIFKYDGSISTAVRSNCDDDYTFTAPLVYDLDGLLGNGQDVIFGCMLGSDDYKIYTYNSDLNFRDDYPEIGNVEGSIMSNLFRLDCFSQTPTTDIGVLGFRNSDDTINLLCITERENDDGVDREFIPEIIGDADTLFSTVSFATDMQYNSVGNILTSAGIISMEEEENIFDDGGINIIWELPKDGIVLAADPQDTGLNDIVIANYNNIWYIDDKFANSDPEISIEVDPCNPIKTDETVSVFIEVFDTDSDNVRVVMDSYVGTDNETSTGWSAWVSSGTTIALNFNADVAGLNNILRITAEDDDDETSTNTTLSYVFQVNNNGNERGDCTSEQTTIPTVTDEEETELADAQEEIKENLKDSLSDIPIFGGFFDTASGLIVLALLITVVCFGIGYSQHESALAGIVWGAMGFMSSILLGIIPLFWIIAIVILIVLAVILVVVLKTGANN